MRPKGTESFGTLLAQQQTPRGESSAEEQVDPWNDEYWKTLPRTGRTSPSTNAVCRAERYQFRVKPFACSCRQREHQLSDMAYVQ